MRLEFFGAQTLHTKIQFEFHDMSEKYQTYYYQNFLLQRLREIDEQTSTVIVTQVNVYFCFHQFPHLIMPAVALGNDSEWGDLSFARKQCI